MEAGRPGKRRLNALRGYCSAHRVSRGAAAPLVSRPQAPHIPAGSAAACSSWLRLARKNLNPFFLTTSASEKNTLHGAECATEGSARSGVFPLLFKRQRRLNSNTEGNAVANTIAKLPSIVYNIVTNKLGTVHGSKKHLTLPWGFRGSIGPGRFACPASG